jgi:excisionase family DNA binding protein
MLSLKANGENSVSELPEDLIDIQEASKITNLKVKYIYLLIAQKKISAYKDAKVLYFSKAELIEWRRSRMKKIGGSDGK